MKLEDSFEPTETGEDELDADDTGDGYDEDNTLEDGVASDPTVFNLPYGPNSDYYGHTFYLENDELPPEGNFDSSNGTCQYPDLAFNRQGGIPGWL